ncbi:MAG: DUF3592 domain-containing protein [Bifidobacteriaceae bacterium]|nr:DUF3592 domain-containing protein [Bifidobacteriaceae bacterium]
MLLAAAALSLGSYRSETAFVRYDLPHWKEADATVVDQWVHSRSEDSDGRTTTTWGYRLTFESANGLEEVEGTSTDSAVGWLEPGERVTVTYDPDRPSRLRFGSKSSVRSEAISLTPVFWAVALAFGATVPFWGMKALDAVQRRHPDSLPLRPGFGPTAVANAVRDGARPGYGAPLEGAPGSQAPGFGGAPGPIIYPDLAGGQAAGQPSAYLGPEPVWGQSAAGSQPLGHPSPGQFPSGQGQSAPGYWTAGGPGQQTPPGYPGVGQPPQWQPPPLPPPRVAPLPYLPFEPPAPWPPADAGPNPQVFQ